MPYSGFSLDGKIALVTGASRGLGLEIAKALVEAGATVLLNGRNQERLDSAIASANVAENQLLPLCFDVSDETAVSRAFAHIEAEYGRLDILVNNVGIRDRRTLYEFEKADIQNMVDINLIAPFDLARRAAKMMTREGNGRIINMTSIAGMIARKNDPVYPMIKGGMTAMTRALAADLGEHSITVNGIAPGYMATETNMYMVGVQEHIDWLQKRTSLGRWGNPEEIAGAAVFLASPSASYITGHILVVDGGYMAHW